ncbi:MAG TPA: shikimate kinase [Pirellulaceae bacterium]|nr:shikimate kinase [Pirellulaceae bacterium]
MNLYLVGYRGSGKTTVAQLVADEIGLPWIDADAALEQRAGKTIREIFAESGEETFRGLESAELAILAGGPDRVVALGGGAVLREQNRQLIQDSGRTAWLRARAETLLTRIETDATTAQRRPNLTSAGGLAEIEQLLAVRTPIYAECADYVVDVDDLSPADVAAAIVAWWRTL